MSQPINPYASPQFDSQTPLDVTYEPRLGPPYRSAAGQALVANLAAGFLIFAELLLLVSLGMQILMLLEAIPTGVLDQQTATNNDMRQQALSILVIVGAIASLITFLVWVHAAHRNLPALKPSGKLEFTPGWSVGWFFIPIMNLFKPYQAVTEIWNHSDPRRLQIGLLPRSSSGSALIGWWWGLRIIGAIAERVLSSAAGQNETLEGLLTISWVAIGLMLAMDLPMLICQILMVRRIQRNQEQRQLIVEGQGVVAA